MSKSVVLAGVVAILLGAGIGIAIITLAVGEQPNQGDGGAEEMITLPSGLKYVDIRVGDGPEARTGKNVTVHYTGKLTNGTKFDSSLDRNEPFTIPLGQGRVIKGWDEGLQGMKPGGKRKLIIPPAMGYGAQGAGEKIPPNSTLIFEVEMLKVE